MTPGTCYVVVRSTVTNVDPVRVPTKGAHEADRLRAVIEYASTRWKYVPALTLTTDIGDVVVRTRTIDAYRVTIENEEGHTR